jgi:hypothetical protein
MIFVLGIAVAVGVIVPFTFGKSTALLSVSPLLQPRKAQAKVPVARPKAGSASAPLAYTRHTHRDRSSG